MLKYLFQNNTIHGLSNQSLISTFVKAGDRDRVKCTKYKWSVYGYHRLPSLKEDVVLHMTRQPLKKRIIFIGALGYMHIFVVMFEMYMLCVSSDISHHVYYILYYTMLGFLALLEFEK